MWNRLIALTPEEQKIVARTRKARKFFVFVRERRHELLDTVFQDTLPQAYPPEPGGKAHAKHNYSAQHTQGAKRNQGAQNVASQAQHSARAGHNGNPKGAGHSGKLKSDATPTPTPKESPSQSPTPTPTLGLSAMATPTPSP